MPHQIERNSVDTEITQGQVETLHPLFSGEFMLGELFQAYAVALMKPMRSSSEALEFHERKKLNEVTLRNLNRRKLPP